MSFFTASNGLARDMWPHYIGRPIHDVDTIDTLPQSRIVPTSIDGLCDWATVIPVRDSRRTGDRRFVLVHSPVPDNDDDVTVVSFRVQGIVKSAILATLDNWTGEPRNSVRAMQSVTLTSGGHHTPFTAQIENLATVEEYIACVLNSDLKPSPLANDQEELTLKRRVFTRVHPTLHTPPIILRSSDDPQGQARKISRQWVVCDKLTAARQVLSQGTLLQCPPIAVRPGDFVDVGFTMEASVQRSGRTSIVSVHLVLEHLTVALGAIEIPLRTKYRRDNGLIVAADTSMADTDE
ncbi:uncharacterized protein LAESUDRAFT_758131 [Laetiporus sulphureus 93-53]|uniref:Uncharacterized protein n=1 Tax=Laetiporus sulphureus 93-53 TaxID=1314785 RepID=A0A165EZ06_9APHY|nr:uncharacterized protein LAESUDRAFT_758131 [Laetiporus sulphureus 93-53]KZT08013.1 hypothetical protein LAESUDRAFT_758131 [Laetiporus sulphureus 93-53]